jgi:hypothetical protein
MNGSAAGSKGLNLLLEERIMLMPVLGYGKIRRYLRDCEYKEKRTR